MEDLEQLKEERDQLNKRTQTLIKKSKETTSRVKKLRAELKEKKSLRDEENEKVKEFKEKRDAVNAKINERLKEINKIQNSMNDTKSDSDLNPHQAKKQLERLEWKVQTEVIGIKQEEKIVKRIEELQESMKSGEEFFENRKKLSTIKKELDELRKEAQAFHEVMLEHARKSEFYHQEMVKMYEQLKSLEPEFKEVSDKITKAKKKADKAHTQYISKYKDEKGQTKKEISESMKKRADQLMEEFKKGKKLTTDELQVIQKYG